MKPITIDLLKGDFLINGISLSLPVHIDKLKGILNFPVRGVTKKYNTIYTWDSLGILAYSKNGKMVESLLLSLQIEDFDFSAKESFKGQFHIHSENAVSYYKNNKNQRVKTYNEDKKGSIVVNDIGVRINFGTRKKVKSIEISHFVAPNLKKIPAEKYEIKKLDEEIIEFSDFGFKICIIEELMYNKGLLQPKFDLDEFVEWYEKRDIDLEEEGYEPIPEVTQYFKDLPIPKKWATEITEIYQDGGNDIYLQLLRFGEGWEDCWDIEKADDAKLFPNLKKITLCYAKKNVIDELNEMGIESKWL